MQEYSFCYEYIMKSQFINDDTIRVILKEKEVIHITNFVEEKEGRGAQIKLGLDEGGNLLYVEIKQV